MSKLLSVSDLRAKYKHEIQHTDHVTYIGLQIFDHIAHYLELSDKDRILLKAACELHDIGFIKNQPEHALSSAQIVLKEGIENLDKTQTSIVAAAILLHSRNYQKMMQNPVYKNLSYKKSADRIASILRIADGLDHGHIQDAVIKSIRKTKREILIKVRSDGYPGNAPWASGKSDLWNNTFEPRIKIVIEEPKKSLPRYYGVIHKNDSILNGARKLLMTQLRIIGDNRSGAILGEHPEHLHDLRVAARRFRAALRFFRPLLSADTSNETDQALAALSSQLGNARDADVWMMFLQNTQCSDDPSWNDYCIHQCNLRKASQQELGKLLESDVFWKFWKTANHYLRLELPSQEKSNNKKGSLRVHCARKLIKLNKTLLNKKIKLNHMSEEELHNFRKLCRKARYWSEFAAPILGNKTRIFARRLRKLADDMGDVHDMDVHLNTLAQDKDFNLPSLNRKLRKTRAASLRRARKSWRNLNDKDFTNELICSLNKIRTSVR